MCKNGELAVTLLFIFSAAYRSDFKHSQRLEIPKLAKHYDT